MSLPHPRSVSVAEHLRRVTAGPIAFLATALGLVCLVNLADVLPSVGHFAGIDERFVGWAGLGMLVGVTLAAVAVLAAGSIGAGPVLSLGAAAAVFGLALSQGVVDELQLTLSPVILGGAVGCLLGGVVSMTMEVPPPYRTKILLAWAIPIASAWPLLTWLARHVTDDDGARLTMHPSVWLLAPVSAAIVLWSAWTMLMEPDRIGGRPGPAWETAWTALLASFAAAGVAIMMLGYDPGIRASWLRPLIVVITALVAAALVGTAFLVPAISERIGYLTVLFVALCLPICMQLLIIVADDGDARVGWPATALLVAAGAVGVWYGWRRPRPFVVLGLLTVAAACVGGWVMPDAQWLMVASAAPFALGAGVALGGGLHWAYESPMGLRFAAVAVIGSLLLGTVAAVPLGWALTGSIAATTDDARAVGRVFLGLTFALAVMAAAAVSVMQPPAARVQPTAEPVPAEHAA